MNKLSIRSKKVFVAVSDLERKHKVITYISLLFLTVSTYFLRSENENVKIEFATLKERNLNLKNNMVLFNRSYEEFPLPIWQKVKRGDEFIMNYVNPKYMEEIGFAFDYDKFSILGKNNFELYGNKSESLAQSYYEHDIAVSITGEKLEIEKYLIGRDGKKRKVLVLKWRDIKDNKDTLVYGMIKDYVIDDIKK